MGIHTSENNKQWKATEKEQIVRRYFEELIGRQRLAKEENISSGILSNWEKNIQSPNRIIAVNEFCFWGKRIVFSVGRQFRGTIREKYFARF